MNHDEWLEWRRQGIGSSDSASIMGTSPYTTPYQLWEEKLGRKRPEKNTRCKNRNGLNQSERKPVYAEIQHKPHDRQIHSPDNRRVCFCEIFKILILE